MNQSGFLLQVILSVIISLTTISKILSFSQRPKLRLLLSNSSSRNVFCLPGHKAEQVRKNVLPVIGCWGRFLFPTALKVPLKRKST